MIYILKSCIKTNMTESIIVFKKIDLMFINADVCPS